MKAYPHALSICAGLGYVVFALAKIWAEGSWLLVKLEFYPHRFGTFDSCVLSKLLVQLN